MSRDHRQWRSSGSSTLEILKKDSTIQGWSPGPGQGKGEDVCRSVLEVQPCSCGAIRPRGCCKLAGK